MGLGGFDFPRTSFLNLSAAHLYGSLRLHTAPLYDDDDARCSVIHAFCPATHAHDSRFSFRFFFSYVYEIRKCFLFVFIFIYTTKWLICGCFFRIFCAILLPSIFIIHFIIIIIYFFARVCSKLFFSIFLKCLSVFIFV